MSRRRRDQHQREHSRRRAAERFDLKLTRNIRATLIRLTESPLARYVGLGDCGRPIFRVPLDSVGCAGRWARVVCDRKTGQLVTLLPD